MTWLLVAAGGGGDALAACMLAEAVGEKPRNVVVATFAWERLRVDPLPGPRGAKAFEGLRWEPPGCPLITADSRPLPPSGSMLPRLSEELDRAFLLMDPSGGGVSLREQIRHAVRAFDVERVTVVDVGGDVLARGDEPDLRSPLADALALAACSGLTVPVTVATLGPGLDGEIPEPVVLARGDTDRTTPIETEHVRPFLDVLRWYPSEATGMLAAAVRGVRGAVEVRSEGLLVRMTDRTPFAYWSELAEVLSINACAEVAAGTHSLAEVDDAMLAITGKSELAFERQRAAELEKAEPKAGGQLLAEELETLSQSAAARGADFLTTRRIAEVLKLRMPEEELRSRLALLAPERYTLPLWRTAVSLRRAASKA